MTTENGDAAVAILPAPKGNAMLRALRIRDFRLLFSGETVSVLGDQFHFVALAWLTLQLTGSGLALGGVLMVAAIPRAIFMLVGGALSDRFSPRSLLLYSNVTRSVLVGIIAGLVITGHAELWQLYVMAACFGVADALFYPALSSILPMLVDEPTLPPANALMQTSQQLATLIGPAIAGIVVAVLETGAAFAFDAISFAVAAVAVVLIAGGRRGAAPDATAEPRPGILATIPEGIAHMWRDPALRTLVLLVAALNLAFTGPLSVGIPYLAKTSLGGGAAAFGILLSGFGAGALVGALAAGSVERVPRLGTVMLSEAVVLGILLGLIGVAPSIPVALGLLAAIGLGVGFLNVRAVSWLQARTPGEILGRVMSIVMLASVGLTPVSFAVAGAIVDLDAIALMFAAAGGIIVLAAIAGFASGAAGRIDAEPVGDGES